MAQWAEAAASMVRFAPDRYRMAPRNE